jgi:hypothetical protein
MLPPFLLTGRIKPSLKGSASQMTADERQRIFYKNIPNDNKN